MVLFVVKCLSVFPCLYISQTMNGAALEESLRINKVILKRSLSGSEVE